MALAGQVISHGQAGGPGADDGHGLARRLRAFDHFPPLAAVVVYGVALELADGDRFVDGPAVAGALARMGADVSAHRRERYLFTDDCHGFAGFALRDGANIARRIHPGRAAVGAGCLEGPFLALFRGFDIYT